MAGGRAQKWLQEERRNVLGHWVAFCPACGHTLRFFEESEGELPAECPGCHAGPLTSRCPGCGGLISSAFAVDCEACGTELRPAEWHGVKIRRDDA